MAPFEGFDQADFDAFEERKWASNAFNLERLEVKLKLIGLGKAVAASLGDRLAGQQMEVSEERPSIFNQHRVSELTLYFLRDGEARRQLGAILDKAKTIADAVSDPAPHHKHLVLGVRIDLAGLQAGLFLHRDAWADWKNALERCRAYGEPERLRGLLRELPEAVCWDRGAGLGAAARSAREVDWLELVEGFETAEPWTVVGQRLERGDPRLADASLIEQVTELFGALLPLHAFIGWSRQNDHHALREVLRERQEKVQRRFSEIGVGDEVRILKGLAAGRVGVVEAIEKKGQVKVRLGNLLLAVQIADLAQP